MYLKAILKKHNIEPKFPPPVIKEAGRTPLAVPPNEFSRRQDFRAQTIITIDGEDARDLDDAVSIEKNNDGTYTLGVHIADVTHYVREGTAIDREARYRATSVYFPDAVIPMLPKELSNGICSLNGGVDRLTLSCVMKIDGKGRVVSHKISESVIKTTARMTYTDVAVLLDDKEAEPAQKAALSQKYTAITPMLPAMRELAGILENMQKARGSIDFDIPEAKIIMDESGAVADVIRADRNAAHKIIEQFMIIANETVAAHMTAKKIPCVYRIHETPSLEKMLDFYQFAGQFGYKMTEPPEAVKSATFQRLLEKVKNTPQENVFRKVMLRSMQKAVYSEKNAGHFGLASRCYCHFTSPIRRYPDLMVHRVLKAELSGRLDEKTKLRYKKEVMSVSETSSQKEREAEEAERDADDIKMTEYMTKHVGEDFDATISGVTSFGLFAELQNTVEGLIKIDTLSGGPYTFFEKRFSLRGRTHSYSLGDKVRVKCVRTDTTLGHIDFILAGENENHSGRFKPRKPHKGRS